MGIISQTENTSRHQPGDRELGRPRRRGCRLLVRKGSCPCRRGRLLARFGLDRRRIAVHCGTAREPVVSKDFEA
jgi:hypothetical protein